MKNFVCRSSWFRASSFFFILLLLFCPPSNALSDDGLVIVYSELWMPYNGVPGSAEEGYAVDILKAILQEEGFKVLYEERPWKRSVADVADGKADLVIGAFKFEMPTFIFPETTIGETTMGFYSYLPNWKFAELDDLRRVKIGVVSGYGYRKWLLKDIEDHPDNYESLSGEDAFPRLIKMLLAGRIQAIPSSSAVMDYYIMSHGLKGRLHLAGFGPNPQPEKIYYAFSPARPERSKKLVRIIDAGMKRLRASGKLDAILAKYGLRDWE